MVHHNEVSQNENSGREKSSFPIELLETTLKKKQYDIVYFITMLETVPKMDSKIFLLKQLFRSADFLLLAIALILYDFYFS